MPYSMDSSSDHCYPGTNCLINRFGTLALQNGVDVKTVSSMLGHFDAGFTLRTYTHVTRQMQESAAEKLGNSMAQIL